MIKETSDALRNAVRTSIAKECLISILLLLLAIVIYGTTIQFDFVWDDHEFIRKNPAIREWSMLPRYFTDIQTMSEPHMADDFRVFRPLRNISYLLDYKLVGLKPAWWHLHNILLHALNAILLYWVMSRFLRKHPARIPASVIAALLFLLHPVQTEAVAWIKGRDDLLSTTFALWGVIVLLSEISPSRTSRRHTCAMLGLHLAACLSKVQALAVLPLVSIASYHSREKRTHLSRFALLLITSGLFIVWRHLVLGQTAQTAPLAGSPIRTILEMGPVFLRYGRLIVFPHRLLADYDYLRALPPTEPLLLAASWLVLISIAIAAVWLAYTKPRYRMPFAWIAAAMLPVSNMIPMMQYMAERFLYLPMAGIAWCLGLAIADLLSSVQRNGHRNLCLLLMAILLVLLTGRTLNRLPDWQNNRTLFEATVRDEPHPSKRSHFNLLIARINDGDYEKAEKLIAIIEQRWGETDMLSAREKASLLRNRAKMHWERGNWEEKKAYLEEAIRLDPSLVDAWLYAGVLYAKTGKTDAAMQHLNHALSLHPDNATALYNRAILHQQLGNRDQALEDFLASINSEPRENTYLALAAMLWDAGQIADAIRVYEAGLRHFPDNEEMLHWRKQGQKRLSHP